MLKWKMPLPKQPAKLLIVSRFSLIVLFFLSACSGFPAAEPENPPLKVEYTQWWGDYTLLIAQEKGFFEKHGVAVEPVYYEVFYEALPDLAGGKIGAGLLALSDVLTLASQADIKAVYVNDNGGANSIVATPDIHLASDLRGKRIGVPVGTFYEIFVQEILRQGVLETQDVTIVNVDPELVPEKLGVEIDAGYVWEPYTSQALRQGNRLLYSSGTSGFSLAPDVITFRSVVAEERPEDVRAFLRAWVEAVNYRQEHADECNQIIARILEIPLEEVAGDAQIYTLEDNLASFVNATEEMDDSIYYAARSQLEFLTGMGLVTTWPDLYDLLDDSFLE